MVLQRTCLCLIPRLPWLSLSGLCLGPQGEGSNITWPRVTAFPLHVGCGPAELQREPHLPWGVMKTAQQGRGEQAPAEQTEAPVGPSLASLLWAKPDTRASFRWLHDTHTQGIPASVASKPLVLCVCRYTRVHRRTHHEMWSSVYAVSWGVGSEGGCPCVSPGAGQEHETAGVSELEPAGQILPRPAFAQFMN